MAIMVEMVLIVRGIAFADGLPFGLPFGFPIGLPFRIIILLDLGSGIEEKTR